MRKKVILICPECLSRNYSTTKKEGATANLVHPKGIWREVDENTEVYYREKVLEGGYSYHSGKPASGTYYIRIVNGSNVQKTGIKLKARFHTPA